VGCGWTTGPTCSASGRCSTACAPEVSRSRARPRWPCSWLWVPRIRRRSLNPAVPQPLADLIHQLLAKTPCDRPPSADEVATRLRTLARGSAPAAVSGQATAALQVVYVPIQMATLPGADPFAELDATEAEVAPGEKRAKSRGVSPWVAAGLAALVAMVFGGVVIIIRNRDGSETRIEVHRGCDGDGEGERRQDPRPGQAGRG
jgi:hypothetical protein